MFVPTLPPPAPPHEAVAYLADGVRRLGGLGHDPVPYERVRLDPFVGAEIADAYMCAPPRDPCAFDAYAALSVQTVRQYHFLIGRIEYGGLGMTIRAVDDDPYPDAASLLDDLRARRLRVFASAASGNPHPYLSDGENDMFRAVHDAFGHGASGRGFDAHGEEAAWLKHCQLYTPLARRALATEIRGQTCALAFRGRGCFPEQKAVLLPRRFSDPRSVCIDRDPVRASVGKGYPRKLVP
ncbi:hypothetical protein ACQP2P_21590 [Dactylosporangium sp. CA-139114]|uniref:hypothetical protein n=1 Tax=Dactylosporangium sp. CA-139114 TaxID=3239931 RepID=UPI003D973CD6